MTFFTPTNFPDGVTNAAADTLLGSYGAPDPAKFIEQFDDFFSFSGATTGANFDWVITTNAAGVVTVTDANAGVITVSNVTVTEDLFTWIQWHGGNLTTDVAETWRLAAGKQSWFKAKFSLADVLQSDIIVGLVTANVTPFTAVVDGIYFEKVDGSAALNLKLTKASVSTTVAVATMVAATMIEVGFHYDGVSKVSAWVNGQRVNQTLVMTNLPLTEELALSFGVANGEGVAKVLSMDFIFMASER